MQLSAQEVNALSSPRPVGNTSVLCRVHTVLPAPLPRTRHMHAAWLLVTLVITSTHISTHIYTYLHYTYLRCTLNTLTLTLTTLPLRGPADTFNSCCSVIAGTIAQSAAACNMLHYACILNTGTNNSVSVSQHPHVTTPASDGINNTQHNMEIITTKNDRLIIKVCLACALFRT